jgi:hypothetical protein
MRKAMAFPVRFVTKGQSVQTTSRDLDEGSVFVRCVEPPEEGERVVLRLYLPGIAAGDPIQAVVRERLAEGREAGFRAVFQDLSSITLGQIRVALETGAATATAGPEARAHAGENRRLLPRYLDRFHVLTGQHRERQDALNLSASGLFIETETPPPLDEIVQVILELPDGQPPAEAQAIVLRRVLPGGAEPAGAGVQFIGADDAFRARLDGYLETLKAR